MTDEATEARIAALLSELTTEEKVRLLAGASMWQTEPIERLGIPAIKVSDGPNGARGGGSFVGGGITSSCFPAEIGLAASWDIALLGRVGAALADETRAKGASLLLAPTVNIHRSPLNGRNFECFSEDPYLSARMAVAYIGGLQAAGVGATVKHFIGNDSEYQRNSISSEIDERTLREIYLPPFEAAVREAGTWAVMSSYNRVNGTYVGESAPLLRTILKDEWGFDGLVMSDWFGTQSTAAAAAAGLDLEMPGPPRWRGAQLLEALDRGTVPPSAIDDSVRRVLRTIARAGAFADGTIPEERAIDTPERRALLREAAAATMVLLKNDGGALPLDRARVGSIAIIGPNAQRAVIMGGGSAQVNAPYAVNPHAAIVERVGDAIELGYALGATNYKDLPLLIPQLVADAAGAPGLTISYYTSLDLSGEPVHTASVQSSEQVWLGSAAPGVTPNHFSAALTGSFTPHEDGVHRFSLVSAGRARLLIDGAMAVNNWQPMPGGSYFGMGSTEVMGEATLVAGRSYVLRVEYSTDGAPFICAVRLGCMTPVDPDAIAKAAALAAQSDVALVFVGTNGDWEGEGNDRADMRLPGEQDALIAAVAAANARTVVVLQTGSPVEMPWLADVAAVLQAWYPGQECGNAIGDVLFGAVNPAGKLPQTFPLRLEDNPAYFNYPGENGRVRYGERIFVGYRAYEAKDVAPLFPFGFGLSYTSFAYGDLRISTEMLGPGDLLEIQLDITNTGAVAGSEVVQLYIRDLAARVQRPPQELKGFARLTLAPGETATATFAIDRRALSFWDDAAHAWEAEPGAFEARVGASSQDIRRTAGFTLVG